MGQIANQGARCDFPHCHHAAGSGLLVVVPHGLRKNRPALIKEPYPVPSAGSIEEFKVSRHLGNAPTIPHGAFRCHRAAFGGLNEWKTCRPGESDPVGEGTEEWSGSHERAHLR